VRLVLLGAILILSIMAWSFRKPIESRLMERLTLSNDAPSPDVLEELIAQSSSPSSAIVAAWNTDKMVHREVAIRQIGRSLPKGQPLPLELEAMLVSGALDPDQNVCEISFSGLLAWSHPELPALATHQLHNVDPEIRRLGLDFLRRQQRSSDVPAIMPLLDDAQPDIAALALHTLGRISGQNFGIKLADAIAVEDEQSGLKAFKPESFEKVQAAVSAAKVWFQQNPPPASTGPLSLPEVAISARRRIPAGDFDLATLDGSRFRLSEARGKVVLINFWTTWCTACLGELPALIELRKRHGPEVVILGISLDSLADSHGHVGGHTKASGTTDEGHHAHDGHHHDDEEEVPSIQEIRRKVEATVKRRGINYPVLIDAHNEVGSRFNGGELPTTVIIDKEGFVRRRFVGPRSVAVFEAMITEATQPDPLIANSRQK
jgi:thiol-disulfide isomerase/thioredoxin